MENRVLICFMFVTTVVTIIVPTNAYGQYLIGISYTKSGPHFREPLFTIRKSSYYPDHLSGFLQLHGTEANG
ncbi:hypothetical protein D3C87_877410 [compost metagenome]